MLYLLIVTIIIKCKFFKFFIFKTHSTRRVVAPIIKCNYGNLVIYIDKNTSIKLKCEVINSNPYPIKFLWQNEANKTLLENKLEYEFVVKKDANIRFTAVSGINFNDTVVLFVIYINKGK